MIPFKRALFLGSHPDDECGCSGTLARFLEEEKELFFVIFSFCEESVRSEFLRDIQKSEFASSMKTLGVEDDHVFSYDFKVRHFPASRQEILEILVSLNKTVNPDLILLPASEDIHQDHHTLAIEGLRAFKHRTILGYEIPHNMMRSQNTCFIRLEKRHINKKVEIMKCYKSQEYRYYFGEDYIRALAKVRGIQVRARAAEMFEIVRLII